MVKQTKTFKKGNVTKKALSAILAASMVMTSSSFVMAAPVEVEDVAVEAAAVDVVEDVDAGEENVGEIIEEGKVTVETGLTYTGSAITPKIEVKDVNDKVVPASNYTVEYFNSDNEKVTVKDAGNYKAKVTFTSDEYKATGSIEKTFTVAKFPLKDKGVEVKYNQTGYFYNGTVQTPSFEITATDAPADINNAFQFVAVKSPDPGNKTDMKSAGTQQVKLELTEDGQKNYDPTGAGAIGVLTYIIDKAKAADFKGTVTAEDVVYDGVGISDVKSAITVKDASGAELTSGDYNVEVTDEKGNKVTKPTDIGTYTVTVTTTGAGNYEAGGKATGTLKIVNSSLATAIKNATIGSYVKDEDGAFKVNYSGNVEKIEATSITIPGLNQGGKVDYKVKETSVSVKNVGDVKTFTIEGVNEYSNQTATLTVKVVAKNLESTWFEGKDSKGNDKVMVSKGATSKEDVMFTEIKDGALDLVAGQDFEVESIDTKNKKIVIIGKGNYTTALNEKKEQIGVKVDYVVATGILVNDEKRVSVAAIADQKYTGKQVTPVVVVTDKTTGKTLEKGADKDYTVTYDTNINTGKGKVTITGKNNYTGTKTVEFNIVGTDINDKYELAPISSVDYSKTTNTAPKAKLVYKSNKASAPVDVTFEAKYFDAEGNDITDNYDAYIKENVAKLPLTITVKATGIGAYSGEASTTYTVVGSDSSFTVTDIADQDYTGKAIEPAVVVTPDTMKKDVDYTVTYENNVKVGTAYAIVKGIGKYTGTKVVSFNIVGEMDQTIEVLAAQERDLGNGTRTLNSKPTKIKYATAPETTVTYTSSNPDVVTVDEEGNVKYTGIGEATITIEAKAENGYKTATKEVKVVVTLAKPSFTPFSKNNAFTLTSSTVKGAEKFEVEYATKKDFSNSKTKTFATTSAGKVRQVKVSAGDKKTYYVRVRAISGTTKSAWSTVKTVATK